MDSERLIWKSSLRRLRRRFSVFRRAYDARKPILALRCDNVKATVFRCVTTAPSFRLALSGSFILAEQEHKAVQEMSVQGGATQSATHADPVDLKKSLNRSYPKNNDLQDRQVQTWRNYD